MSRQTLIYRLPVVIYCVVIFVQSAFPSPEVLEQFDWSDKSLHFMGYALLGALLVRMFKREFSAMAPWKVILLSVLVGTFYGISDELHQAMVPGRFADVRDVLADMLGIIPASVLFWLDLPFVDRPVNKN